MSTFLKVGVILAWLCLQSSADVTIEDLPPVLEGSSITLTCTGRTKTNNRSVFWQAIGQDNVLFDAASCDSSNIECDNSLNTKCQHLSSNKCIRHNVQKYFAEIHSTDRNFTTQLAVYNITYSERGTVYKCTVFDPQHKITALYKTWKLSEIFLIPESPTCEARSDDGLSINISCQTSRVYPDLACTLSQDGKDFETNMHVRKQLKSNHTYYSASCSFVLHENLPGSYSFTVKMFPGLSIVGMARAIVYKKTNTVNIPSQPLVKLTLPELKCFVNNSHLAAVNVSCSAFWFSAAPNITFYIGDTFVQPVLETNSSFNVGNYTYNKFVFTYNISDLASLGGNRLQCFEDKNGTNELKDEKDNKFVQPPTDPPVFKDKTGQQIRDTLVIPEGENVTLVCEINGGEQPVSSTEIECRSKAVSTMFRDNSTRVSATITLNETPDWSCSCRGQHVSQCYNLVTTVVVSLPYENESQTYDADITYTVLYIMIAQIFGIVLLFLIGFVIYYRKQIPCTRQRILCLRCGRYYDCVHTDDNGINGISSASEEKNANLQDPLASTNCTIPERKVSPNTTHKNDSKIDVLDAPPLLMPRSIIHLSTSRKDEITPPVHFSKEAPCDDTYTTDSNFIHYRDDDDCLALPPPRLPPRKFPFRSADDIVRTVANRREERHRNTPLNAVSSEPSFPKPCGKRNPSSWGIISEDTPSPNEEYFKELWNVPASLNFSSLQGSLGFCNRNDYNPEIILLNDTMLEKPKLPARKPLLKGTTKTVPDILENC